MGSIQLTGNHFTVRLCFWSHSLPYLSLTAKQLVPSSLPINQVQPCEYLCRGMLHLRHHMSASAAGSMGPASLPCDSEPYKCAF